MGKLGTMKLTGASGTEYSFDVYPIENSFNPVGAVYYISKRTQKTDGTGFNHSNVYIGQTGDLSERFDNHHKSNCFSQHNANCVSIHQDESEDSRLDKEADLIKAYQPPCNG